MKAAEQYFPAVLFIMLYKTVLTFESVDEILKYDHSSESNRAVLSCYRALNYLQLKIYSCSHFMQWKPEVRLYKGLKQELNSWYCPICNPDAMRASWYLAIKRLGTGHSRVQLAPAIP